MAGAEAAAAAAGGQKRLAWQYYISYFMGGFITSMVFEGALILSVYFNGDAVAVATLFAASWVIALFMYVFVRSCCTWWVGDEDALDELERRSKRGESRWEADVPDSGSGGANETYASRKATIHSLFTYETTEVTTAATKRAARERERRIVIVVFLASALGIVGGFAGSYFFQSYWYYANGPTYFDVDAVADPSAIADAHLIHFAPGTTQSTSVFSPPRGGLSVASLTTGQCVAQTLNPSTPNELRVGFWSVYDNCCSGSVSSTPIGGTQNTLVFTCSTFGSGATLGEVLRKDLDLYQVASRRAVEWFGFEEKVDAMYVRIVTQSEHDSGQRVRLLTAWVCLCAGPLGWPFTIAVMIALEACLSACDLFNPDASKRCACCNGVFRCKCCASILHNPGGADLYSGHGNGGSSSARGGGPVDPHAAVMEAELASREAGKPLTGAELRELAAKKRAEHGGFGSV